MTVELRRRYRDPISGYEGVALSRTEHAYSSPQVKLVRGSSAGLPEEQWFPEAQVEPADATTGPGFARTES